jgi:hypothetical protein
MMVLRKALIAGAAALWLLSANASTKAGEGDAALKRDAIERLAHSHDPALSVGIGRVYIKQAALLAAREVLADRGRAAGLTRTQWNPQVAQWQAAERELMQGIDDLVRDRVASGVWVQQAWGEAAAQTLNGEEADEIAVHFQSEGGQLQRKVIEWFVGELTLQTYTFTDRLKYGVPGSEEEMRDLQIATYDRMVPGIYDLTSYPDAVKFASVDPGVKYFKMMVMQGVHAVHTYLEACAEDARRMVRERASRADPHIAQVASAKS